MPVYAYKGLSAAGRNVSGIIDADSPKGARLKLRGIGVFPTDLAEERAAAAAAGPIARSGVNFNLNLAPYLERIKPQDLALTTRQLSTLVGAGLPLVECLGALIEQSEIQRMKRILSQVRERVTEGGAFADALKEHPRVFTDLYTNMVRAGEASGALDVVLARLAEYTESSARLRSKVQSALTYPILMGITSSGILFFLLAYVVPKITKIFEDNHAQLPVMTVVLLGISNFLQSYWWVIVSLALVITVTLRVWTRTPSGKLRFDTYVLRIPYFGALLKKVALARFARTLSTLLRSGISLLPSLDIVKNVVNNTQLSETIETARNSIREGHSIAPPLKKSGLFPPLLVHMIAVGEKSGELEEMLSRAADAYDNEVESAIAGLTSIMEPMITIFMGGVVLFIVLAIMVPIFNLNQLVR